MPIRLIPTKNHSSEFNWTIITLQGDEEYLMQWMTRGCFDHVKQNFLFCYDNGKDAYLQQHKLEHFNKEKHKFSDSFGTITQNIKTRTKLFLKTVNGN